MPVPSGIVPLQDAELEGQRVLVRADLDLASDQTGSPALDAVKLTAAIATFKHVMERQARLVVAASRGSPRGQRDHHLSLEPAASQIAELAGWEVFVPEDCVGDMPRKLVAELRPGQVCLLENLLFDPRETDGNEAFARELSQLADVFVADALNVLHHTHASAVSLPRLLPHRAMGLALQHELSCFSRLQDRPNVALIGGQYARQAQLAEALLDRFTTLLLGGELGATLLAAQGVDIGTTPIESRQLAQARTLLHQAKNRGTEILLPIDAVVSTSVRPGNAGVVTVSQLGREHRIVDIGPETVAAWRTRLGRARSVLWDGPLSVCSSQPEGSRALLEWLGSGCHGFVLVGPDSAPLLGPLSLDPSLFNHVTQGDGAARELLMQRPLPGLDALRAIR
ncbi:phosphoglycerate kinase [Myxococcota bacterium]